MSSDPIDTPDVPPTAPAPVADYVAANRGPVAIALIAVGVVCLAVGGYYLARGFNAPKAEKKADADQPEAVEIADPNQPTHLVAGILGVMGAAVGIGVGGSVLAKMPKPDVAGQRADARVTILLAGGLFGFVLMIAGLWFFYQWFGSLTAWLDQGKRGEAKWVLGPILAFVAGAALAFVAAQPARAEERNNPLLRRLVYGTNLGLSALLLLLILTVGNVFAALRVPNQLDTTASGFYTLDDSTRQVIASLDQPVTVYNTLVEADDPTGNRLVRDVRGLLTAAQEVDPAKFRPQFLSRTLDRQKIDQLRKDYPQFDPNELGILVVVGDDASRSSFLRTSDLFSQETRGRTPQVVFQGEARLVRELLFLSEGKTRPVVYFTQGHKELEVAPPPDVEARPTGVRTANQLRAALERKYVDVRPLTFDLTNPKVPDDAAVVVVADPQTPLPKEQAEAVRRFMTEPRPGDTTRKGKLIVLTSPHPGSNNTGVADTGLEEVLAGFGVEIGREYLLRGPADGRLTYTQIVTALSQIAFQLRNPIALAFQEPPVMPDVRVVNATRSPPGGPFQTIPLFLTDPSEGLTWLEPNPPSNPARTWEEFRRTPALRGSLKLSQNPRSVAVVVSEPPASGDRNAPPTARLAVYGSGAFFADPEPGRPPSPIPAELFAATLDWLRDRPVVDVANKTYGQYTVKPESDSARLLYLPVGITVLAVLAVGFGMWVFRQK